MVEQEAQPGTLPVLGVFQHLDVAVRVAGGQDRPAADVQLNVDRLARAVVNGFHQPRLAEQDRAILAPLVFKGDVASDDVLAGDAVNLLRYRGRRCRNENAN